MTLDPALMGDLVLGLGGAVAGGLAVAIVAAVTGRTAGLGLLAVGVALGAFGLPVGWRVATHPPTPSTAAAADWGQGAGSSDQDLARVLQRYYPKEYAELKGMEGHGGQWGATIGQEYRIDRIAAEVVQRQAPLADDDNMMALVGMARDAARDLRAASPQRCAEAMNGGAAGLGQGADRAKATAMLTRFLEQTATHPAAAHATVDLSAARTRMMQSALGHLPANERKAIETTAFARMAARSDTHLQTAYCDLAIGVFDELLNHSPHESAAVMRTMMLRERG